MDSDASVSWLELCLDVTVGAGDDLVRVGREVGEFWAATLGVDYRPAPQDEHPGDPGNVVGPPGGGIALCAVEGPPAGKNRVHLDVHTGAVQDLIDLGAHVVEELPGWTVMEDPVGNVLCAFVRDEVPAYRLYEVAVDSVDAESIARWWGERFAVPVRNDGEPWWWLEDIEGAPFESLVFAPVPEPKTVKNRLHWDVRGDVDALERAGAVVRWREAEWVTMADPEGNEFCVFAAPSR